MAPEAWELGATGAGQVVAVVDSGVTIGSDPSSDLPAGRVTGDTTAITPHGTAVAGIIGATHGNNAGISGIAHGAAVRSLRAVNNTGNFLGFDVLQAMFKAVSEKARIINLSANAENATNIAYWTCAAQYVGLPETEELDDNCKGYSTSDCPPGVSCSQKGGGGLLVLAAGNQGGDANGYEPCKSSDNFSRNGVNLIEDTVLCVANTDNNDGRAGNSNHGNAIDLTAPGVGTCSVNGPFSDTSASAPHVAGAAAVLWALRPQWSAQQVGSRLKAAADPLSETGLGEGRLNLLDAITCLAEPDQAATTQDTAVTIPVLNNDKNRNGDPNISGWTEELDVIAGPSHGTARKAGTAISYTPNASFTGDDDFTYRLTCTKGDKTITDTARVSVTVTPKPNPRPAPAVTIEPANADRAEGNDGTTSFTFTVRRAGQDTSQQVEVSWSVKGSDANNSADADDFDGGTFPGDKVIIAANQDAAPITVKVRGDTAIEADEGFLVKIDAVVGGTKGSPSTASGMIRNDDALPVVTIVPRDADKAEGNGGTTNFTFAVIRSGLDLSRPTTVSWIVGGDGANAADAADFVGGAFPTDSVTIPAGQTEAPITDKVRVAGDTAIEPDEAFSVSIVSVVGGTVGSPSSASGVIRNDDRTPPPPPVVIIEPVDMDNPEGNDGTTPFLFTVRRSGQDLSEKTTVFWEVAGSGANPADGADFVGGALPSDSVTIPAGQTAPASPVTVRVQGDTAIEEDEGFSVSIVRVEGGTIGSPSSATGTIRNDDQAQPPFVIIGPLPVKQAEGNSGTTYFVFPVTRTDGDLSRPTTVRWEVSAGSHPWPADDADFVGGQMPKDRITIPSGEAYGEIRVPVAGDVFGETEESFDVVMTDVEWGTPLNVFVTGIITNDDGANFGENLARNTAGSGTPSPLESSRGWGGGALPWEILDGRRSYEAWWHGLAFTGGHSNSSGGPPWGGEAAGMRYAIVDLGSPKTFAKVVIWHHGVEHTPQEAFLDYWNGSAWVPIAFTRTYGRFEESGQNSGYGTSDEYSFSPVTGSKVRYSFDNSGRNVNGTFNIHGWIYEFEVYPPPAEQGR